VGTLFTALVPTRIIIVLFAVFPLLAAELTLSSWKPR